MQIPEGLQKVLKRRRRSKRTAVQSLTAEEFLRSITLIPDIDQLLGHFASKFAEMFTADSIYLVLLEPVTGRYVIRKTKGGKPGMSGKFGFFRNDNLIKWLNVNRRPLNFGVENEIVAFLAPGERKLLSDASIQVILPLIVINRLTGVLFVGRDNNKRRYSGEEESLMQSLVSQSALAIEYAMIYQFQEDKLKRLFHADKLMTVGELAAGAAHEIRNPLAAIRSTVQYLKKDMNEEKGKLAEGIIEEVDRIDKIIKGLLSFSRTSELHMEPLDLNQVIEQTVSLLDLELKKHKIDLVKDFRLQDPRITGDGAQLKQVFLNILMNGIQAMDTSGCLSIVTAKSADRPEAVVISILDTGPGIPPAELARVFDPFYTTKENGTGLGLSISYGIVSRHGGEIEIRNGTDQTKRGTQVIITLPRDPSKGQ